MTGSTGPGAGRPADGGPPVPAARLVLAGVVADLAAGTLFAWSLIAEDAARDVGSGPAAAAAVFAAAVAVFAVVLLAGGPLQRRFGPRRLLDVAAVLAGGGLLLAAGARGPLTLGGGVALLFGTANGLAYGVAVALAARVPAARRGTATGLVVGAYAAGPVLLGVLAPPALRAAGWRPCLAVLALLVAGLMALAARLAPAGPVRPRGRRDRAAPVPRRPVVLLWLVFAGGTAPGLMLFAHAVPLAADRQLPAAAAGLAVSALAAGNLAGRLLAGWWSDHVGRLPALAVALATAAGSVGGLAVPAAAPVVLGAFLLAGTAYGALSSLVPAATADRVDAAAFPAAYGRVFTGWGCAGLLAPLAGGPLTGLAAARPALMALAVVPVLPAAVALLLLAGPGPRRPPPGAPAAAPGTAG